MLNPCSESLLGLVTSPVILKGVGMLMMLPLMLVAPVLVVSPPMSYLKLCHWQKFG